MKLAITSDTHLPRGQCQLPASVVAHLKAADLIVHAGDFSRLFVLRELEAYGEVIAVQGNVDDAQFQIFNPGSPTDRRRSPHHTMGLAVASATGLRFETIVVD